MTTESNRQTSPPAPGAPPAELKASDFFPPGTGWNQAKKHGDAGDRKNAANQPGQNDKH